jgi:hypothetical protein
MNRAKQFSPKQPAPPIIGSADPEYQTRIDAQRVTLQFSQPITAPNNALDYNDLPLFGGNKQEELF